MNRILLVQQYLGTNHEVGPIFPIGLSYIATSISKTHWNVQVLDMNVCQEPYESLLSSIDAFRPDVIGFSLRNIDNVDYYNFNYFYDELNTIIPILKSHCSFLICGGAGFSIFAAKIMEQHKEIDFGILQEGEVTIVELLSALNNRTPLSNVRGLYFWDSGTLRFTGDRAPINFSERVIPDRSFFDIQKYNKSLCMGVQTKRGCSLKCSYCTYPFLNKHSERFRKPVDVVDEIAILVNDYHIDEIIFCDDIFNVPVDHSKEILQSIIDRGIKIKWSAWFDVGSTDEDYILLAIRSGCYRFCFSTEGVVDSSLKLLHKNFDAEQADRLINLCLSKRFQHIEFRFSLFAMPPGQTIFGMIKTIWIVIRTHVIHMNSKCLVSWIRVLPNTELQATLCSDNVNLLPKSISDLDKNLLFYNEASINPFILKAYRSIFVFLESLRKIRKRIKYSNIL